MATHSPLSPSGNQEADVLTKIQAICPQPSLEDAPWVHVRFGHTGANTGWERAKAAIGPKKGAVHMDMRGLFSAAAMADGCYDGANAEIDLSVCAELTDRLHRVYSSWVFSP